jgi:dTDP-4-dehydrorhamnose reductase
MVVETIKKIARPKIILFGASGMLGHALRDVFPSAVFPGHRDVDITDADAVMNFLKKNSPDIVINAAAYTDVDGCEDNEDHAFLVNGKGPEAIAMACNEIGATMVHYSTDYIFNGKSPEYREDARPDPINVYGRSKLMGESGIQKNTDDYRIIRTSWLFGSHGKNFVDTIRALSGQMQQVRVVDDQKGKPTYSVDLAQKTPEILSGKPGIYHITNDGVCSWYEFACAFIPNAVPCSSDQFPRKAQRPAYSILVNTKTGPLRHWKEALKDYIHQKGST